jgi:hypothetical protein
MTQMVKKSRLWLLVIVLLTAQLGIVLPKANVAEAANNGLAAKPYMGWSSYSLQVFTGNGQWITAANIKAQSDAMHEKLQPYGYEYINIDAAWNGGMDGYGRPIPSTTLYPNGFQEVIDYVHANGQKIGLYGIPGLSPQAYDQDLPIYGAPGCSMQDIAAQPIQESDYWGLGYKIDFNQPCAQSYINSIADLYGEWGIDFLKFDSVTPGSGISDLSLDARDDVKAWSQALAPHKIWLELSWALDIKYIDYWKEYANGWRVDWDIECYCGDGGLTTWPSIARLFPKAEQFWRHAGPGGWNDFDSLNIGNGAMDGITPDERRSAMSFWAISSAQLYIGNDMTNLDEYGLELLTNEEVIAVNQAGRPGHPVSTATEQQVWYANNGDGSYTVGLFNLGSSAATVNVNWSDIGLTGPASVRDLWSHEDLGIFDTGYSSVDLPSHASRLFKVVAQNGTVTANDDDTGFKYNGEWTRNGGQELAGDKQNLVIHVSDTTAQNSTISPATASFNKKTSEQADVSTTVTLNGNTLSSLSNNGVTLTQGTDYTVADDVVTIKKEYLATRPVGLTNLTFVFSGGASKSLAVTVSDTTVRDSGVTPATVSFDHKPSAQADITLTTSLRGNALTGVAHEGNALTEGVDYTVSGSQLALKQAFLASLQTGTTKLTFTFNAGAEQKVSLVVRDTSIGGSISINDDDSSIAYTGGWNRSYNRGLGDYKDDVHYAEANNNDYFEYTFTGTGIEFITELDPSQGEMDIYIDNEFKQTVSTYNLGRMAQQPVYNITGLSNGAHTLKAVKKSGYFMLLDKLRVSVPDLIGASTAAFDKAQQQQADLLVTTTGDVSSLSSITNGAAALTSGTDYTAAGNTVVLKKEYLAAQPLGTTSLTFAFNGGATQTLAIAVSDSSATNSDITPKTASFDKKTAEQADVATTLTLNGNTLSGISNDATTLVQGSQYSVADDVVTIHKSYLAALPNGIANLTFAFDQGESQTLTITISDSTGESSSIIPSALSFDKKAGSQADISTSVTFNGNSLVGISDGATALQAGDDYLVSGSQLTIKKEYLASKPNGMTNLTITFSAGVDQTLAIAVSDTSRGRYVAINNDDSEISYKGAWQHGRNRGLGDYKDDVHYTENNNDYFEYTFKGTGIELITEKESAQGDIDIYVDNVFKQSVSTYSANRQVLQTVYSIDGLNDGTHTIKAVKKSGYYMLIDQLKVKIADMISPDAADFDKTAQSDITTSLSIDGSNLLSIKNGGTALTAGTDYTIAGNAITIKKEYLAAQPDGAVSLAISYKGDFQNDLHGTQVNGDYVQFTFTGTGVELLTPKSALQGDIDVYIDGVLEDTVSAHYANRLTQQAVFSISGLANGKHTLKAVKKSGDYMLVDGVRFTVDAATLPSPTPTPSDEPTASPSAEPSTSPSTEPSATPTPAPTSPSTPGGVTTPPPAKETFSIDVGSGKAVLTRSTQADGKKHDEVAMTEEQFRKALESLSASGAQAVNIVVADAKDEVAQTNVTLPKEANAELAAAKLGLGIATDYAKVLVPSSLFEGFSDSLYFRFVPVKEAAKSQEISVRAGKEAVIKLVAGSKGAEVVGRPVSIETNVKHEAVTVILPLKDVKLSESEWKNLGVYIEHSDGSKELLKGEVVTFNDKGDKGLQFTVTGFSLFALIHVPGLAESSFDSPYMNGYEDGTFKPDKKVTRAEIAAILSRLVSHEAVSADIAYGDVDASNWAKEAISQVTQMGLMKGYENGTFGAAKSITRGEMAKLVSTLIGSSDKTGAGFTDVTDHWAKADILNVQAAGIISGYADGSFKPNGELTRAEATSIMNKLLGRAKLGNASQSPWKDVPGTHWAFGDILAASVK